MLGISIFPEAKVGIDWRCPLIRDRNSDDTYSCFTNRSLRQLDDGCVSDFLQWPTPSPFAK